jgi:hypothetical protein
MSLFFIVLLSLDDFYGWVRALAVPTGCPLYIRLHDDPQHGSATKSRSIESITDIIIA